MEPEEPLPVEVVVDEGHPEEALEADPPSEEDEAASRPEEERLGVEAEVDREGSEEDEVEARTGGSRDGEGGRRATRLRGVGRGSVGGGVSLSVFRFSFLELEKRGGCTTVFSSEQWLGQKGEERKGGEAGGRSRS